MYSLSCIVSKKRDTKICHLHNGSPANKHPIASPRNYLWSLKRSVNEVTHVTYREWVGNCKQSWKCLKGKDQCICIIQVKILICSVISAPVFKRFVTVKVPQFIFLQTLLVSRLFADSSLQECKFSCSFPVFCEVGHITKNLSKVCCIQFQVSWFNKIQNKAHHHPKPTKQQQNTNPCHMFVT